MRYLLTVLALAIAFNTTGFTHAQDIIPTKDQTKLLRGIASRKAGVRHVKSSVGDHPDDGHGPITYYTVPFRGGTFSLTWKVDTEQPLVLVFDGKPNGKATHAMKVFVNGAPGKSDNSDRLTLITYDGSTKQKKKANITKNKHHSDAGQWHTTRVTFKGNKATVVLDNETFTATSERFLDPIQKCGVMHMAGTLQTKNVKIQK